MDFNNDSNEKDKGSWYVEEPKHGNEPANSGDPNAGQTPGNGQNEPGDDEIIRRVYIHIEPNTMLFTASMVLGIITVATALLGTVYLPFMLGGIAIVMGILSRDASGTLDFKAKLGILLGTAGIILNIVVVATSVYSVFNNPEQYATFNSVFERVYGENFASFMQENGVSFPIPE
ncbi:MAG: hypothetical protein K5673_01650 [Lachnospiraceae bacterium]|nr:hypothetical protein [Lachnospiraceae bacterium]